MIEHKIKCGINHCYSCKFRDLENCTKIILTSKQFNFAWKIANKLHLCSLEQVANMSKQEASEFISKYKDKFLELEEKRKEKEMEYSNNRYIRNNRYIDEDALNEHGYFGW